MKIFAREKERDAYAFSACRICSFASSIFDIFLRMVPRFLPAWHSDDEIICRDPEIIRTSVLEHELFTLFRQGTVCISCNTVTETNLYTYRS